VLFAVMYLPLRRLVRLLANSSKRSERRRRGRGASPPADGPSATWPSASSPSRPLVHGPDEQDASSGSMVLVRGQPTDAPSLAPGVVKGKWTYKRISAGGRPPFQRGGPRLASRAES
jgi:hypothetical protein